MEQPPEQPKQKTKKPRTEAQQQATAKMLQSLAEKRRADWEQKKTKILAEHAPKIKELVKEQEEQEEHPEAPPETKTKGKDSASKAGQPKPEVKQDGPSINIEEIKAQIKEELKREKKPPKAKQPKKRVIVEESSESEEEVVIVRKPKQAKKAPEQPPNPYDVLESLFFRNR